MVQVPGKLPAVVAVVEVLVAVEVDVVLVVVVVVQGQGMGLYVVVAVHPETRALEQVESGASVSGVADVAAPA